MEQILFITSCGNQRKLTSGRISIDIIDMQDRIRV